MSYLQVQLRKAITPVFDLCRFLQTLALSTFGPLYHQKGAFSLEVLSSLKAWSYRMSFVITDLQSRKKQSPSPLPASSST